MLFGGPGNTTGAMRCPRCDAALESGAVSCPQCGAETGADAERPMSTALDELYGLGYAHSETEDALYQAVTLEQVKQVAQKYLGSTALVIATIKPGT